MRGSLLGPVFDLPSPNANQLMQRCTLTDNVYADLTLGPEPAGSIGVSRLERLKLVAPVLFDSDVLAVSVLRRGPGGRRHRKTQVCETWAWA